MRGATRWLAPLFFLVASLAFAAVNYPPLTGRVVDQADIIAAVNEKRDRDKAEGSRG